jgi:predicted ester cyclase
MQDIKQFMGEYFNAVNGKAKTEDIVDKYVSDLSLKEHIQFYESAFPEYEINPDDMVCEGNKVAVRATFRGKHLGEIMGIAATGKEITGSAMMIYEVNNNKIVKFWIVVDQFAFMQQLGVIK